MAHVVYCALAQTKGTDDMANANLLSGDTVIAQDMHGRDIVIGADGVRSCNGIAYCDSCRAAFPRNYVSWRTDWQLCGPCDGDEL